MDSKIENEILKETQEIHGLHQKIQNGLNEALLGYNFVGDSTQVSQSDTLFKNLRWYLISNMRQLLSEAYVEFGIVRTVVDIPVEDALRGGVEIISEELDEDNITELETHMQQEDDYQTIGQAMKWTRLFGGGGILLITNQDPETDFKEEDFKEGDPINFRAVDMWELFHDVQNIDDDSMSLRVDKMMETEFYNYYGNKVHKSRVMVMKGVQAPSFIRPRLRGWGFSVLEPLVRSINQYLKATELGFEVLDEFKVDIFKIKGLTDTLLTPDGTAKVHQRVQLANREKNFQNALTMDAEDDYQQKQVQFAGLSEAMDGIRKQLASDVRMPMTKLFGTSSAGFSSGEDDIENYNAMVESDVRAKAKFHIIRIIKIRCQELFGFIPEDIQVEFKPLRVLSSEAQENVKNSKFNRLHTARTTGEIKSKEYLEALNKDMLLPTKVDDSADSSESIVGKEGAEKPKEVKATPATSSPAPPAPKNSADWPIVSVMAPVCDGHVLTGKRKDNKKWTFPAGHVEVGETPLKGAMRELMEEAGIDGVKDGLYRGYRPVDIPAKKLRIYPFILEMKNKIMPRTILDGDQEVMEWKWIPLVAGQPELQPENRHAKNDVVMKILKGDYEL